MRVITPIVSLLVLVILRAQGQILPVGSECTVDECVTGFIPTYEDGYADFHNLNVCVSLEGQTTTRFATQTSWFIVPNETTTFMYHGCPGPSGASVYATTTQITPTSYDTISTLPSPKDSVLHPPSRALYPTANSDCEGSIPSGPYNVCGGDQLASVCSCALFLPRVTKNITSWATIGLADVLVTEACPNCSTSVPTTTYPLTGSATSTGSEPVSWPSIPPASVLYPNSTLGSPVLSTSSTAGHNTTSSPCAEDSSSESTSVSSPMSSAGNASSFAVPLSSILSRPWNTSYTRSLSGFDSSSTTSWSTKVNSTSISRPTYSRSSNPTLMPSHSSLRPSSSGFYANASSSSGIVPGTSGASSTKVVTSTRFITHSRTRTSWMTFSNTSFPTVSLSNVSSSIFLPPFPPGSTSSPAEPASYSQSSTLGEGITRSSSVTKSSYIPSESFLVPNSSLAHSSSSTVSVSTTKHFSWANSTTISRPLGSITASRPCLSSWLPQRASQTVSFLNSGVKTSRTSRAIFSSFITGTTLTESVLSSVFGPSSTSSSDSSVLADPFYSSASTLSTTSVRWTPPTSASAISSWTTWVNTSSVSSQTSILANPLSTLVSSTTKSGYGGYGHGIDFYPSTAHGSPVPSKPSSTCVSQPLDSRLADKGYQPPDVGDYAGCRFNPYDKSKTFSFVWAPSNELITNVNGKAAVPRDPADYADAFYTFEEDTSKCGVFDLAFHWENETTYLATYDTDGILGFERSISADQQFHSKDYVTSIWSMDCEGSVYGGLIGGAEFLFNLGPQDRSVRFWGLGTQRGPTKKRMKQVAFVMLPSNREEMEARMIKNMATRMEHSVD